MRDLLCIMCKQAVLQMACNFEFVCGTPCVIDPAEGDEEVVSARSRLHAPVSFWLGRLDVRER